MANEESQIAGIEAIRGINWGPVVQRVDVEPTECRTESESGVDPRQVFVTDG